MRSSHSAAPNPSVVGEFCVNCDIRDVVCESIEESCDPDNVNGGGSGNPCPYPELPCKTVTEPCPNTPLVIDLGLDGFEMGPKDRYIEFAMRGAGSPIHIQWFRIGGNEALLFQDRNGNGVVDDGTELFGSGTSLIESGLWAPNGFVALSQFDLVAHGGNDDGFITADDKIWGNLSLWLDDNADAVCSPNEVYGLDTFAIRALGTIPTKAQSFDSSGNYYPLWSKAYMDLESGTGYPMADIFFRFAKEKSRQPLERNRPHRVVDDRPK